MPCRLPPSQLPSYLSPLGYTKQPLPVENAEINCAVPHTHTECNMLGI